MKFDASTFNQNMVDDGTVRGIASHNNNHFWVYTFAGETYFMVTWHDGSEQGFETWNEALQTFKEAVGLDEVSF